MLEPTIKALAHQLREYGLDVISESSESPKSSESPESSAKQETPGSGLAGQLVVLKRGLQQAQFSIGRELTEQLPHGNNQGKTLLVLPHIGVARATDCRRLGVNYVDEAGNAFITFGDVYVDVRGKRPSQQALVRDRAPEQQRALRLNLFSAKRSRVIFVLLTWPDLVKETVREISGVAGVSVGLVQGTLAQLEVDGFLSRGHSSKLLRQSQLFDLWAMTYPQQLAPTLSLQSFRAPDITTLESSGGAELGGENAVPDLIFPSSLTLYVEEFSPKMAIANRWRRDEHPNVFLRQKFWTTPVLVDLEESQKSAELAVVPSTLIYADLLASGEARQLEVAEILRKQDDRLLRISRS